MSVWVIQETDAKTELRQGRRAGQEELQTEVQLEKVLVIQVGSCTGQT